MPLVPNHAKRRMQKGGLALGFGVHHLRGAAVPLLTAATGHDWVFVDMEHGATSVHDATQICLAALGAGVTPIVRCCHDALDEGTRALDNGALGVIVPHVDTAKQAKRVAQAFRYPPAGHRSWGGPPAAYGFAPPPVKEAQKALNDELLITVMIETPEAVENAAEIAAVEGVDALMIGTSDLSAEMGVPGEMGHKRVQAAYEQVAKACRKSGKILGMGGVYDEVWAKAYIGLGAQFVLTGSDHNFLMSAGSARTKLLRGFEAAPPKVPKPGRKAAKAA